MPIKKMGTILQMIIKYAGAKRHSLTQVQRWQKLENIESHAEDQSLLQNMINDKLTIAKK